MTDHTDLIERLRKDDLFWEAPITCRSEAADALEAAQADVARLTTAYTVELDKVSQRNYELRKENEAALARLAEIEAGASPVQPSQGLQSVADALTIEQLNDKVARLMVERDKALARLAENEGYKDWAYTERNKLVALLSKLFPSGTKRTAIEGWSEDWHGCVYIDLPTGQASWHYHDSQAHLFAHLPPYAGTWDGHTTEQKYERIAGYAAAGASPVQPSQAGEVSKQDIYDIAHRKATRYVFTAAPSDVMYGFSEMHLLDFVAAINAKESK